jgi:membrane protein DedA with SNARE-associated domain
VPLASASSQLESLIGDYGLYAVFALMLVDAVLPAASELVMVYGGALAAGAFSGQNVVLFGQQLDPGWQSYLAIALAGTIGYTLGAVAGWAIGLYGGRPLVERHGRWLHLDAEKLRRAEGWFARYGDAAAFLGRVTPVVRSFVAIPAGVARMPLGPYTLFSLLGSAVWCFGLAGIGWGLGSNWERFHHAFRFADYAIAVLVVAALAYLLYRARGRRRRRGATASAGMNRRRR